MRTEMLDVLDQDYIVTARAKGISQAKVLMKHAVKNSIIPVVTVLGPIVVNLTDWFSGCREHLQYSGNRKSFCRLYQSK